MVSISKMKPVRQNVRAPIGSERRRKRSTNLDIFIKIAEPDAWRLKQYHTWESVHGPVPKGYLVRFIDGDTTNFKLENLTCVSRMAALGVPIGSERHKNKHYTQIKVAEPNAWRLKHHLIWEAVHGPIPEGHIVLFINGDLTNFKLENLTITTHGKLLIQTKQAFQQAFNMPFGMDRPVGHERLAPGGYTQVKVAEPNIWLFKHRLIWEVAHGPIPEGHVVRFLDGDITNFRLENLTATSKKELPLMANQTPLGHEWHMPLRGFIKIKVAPKTWRYKHNLVWEAVHGSIPKGHTLKFIDGNPKNVTLNNLVLVSYGENQYMYKNFPPGLTGEIFGTGLELAKVAGTTKKLAKVSQKKLKAAKQLTT